MLRKIWWKLKKTFKNRVKNFEKRNDLRARKNEIVTFFDDSDKVAKNIDSMLKYYKWRAFLGTDIPRFLRIGEPKIVSFAQHVGFNREMEIQSTDEARILDGIKLPHPHDGADAKAFEQDLSHFILPSYFRRKFENFDHYCTNFAPLLGEFGEGPYEYDRVCLEEGDVVFDCGANMGLFSAVASRYGCRVFAFEAVPGIIDKYLSKTASMNGNISVQNYAIWDKEERLEFSFIVDNIGGSRCDQLLRRKDLHQKREQLSIPAITLDVFVERNGIERVDFIKADIEGAERNMLRGARGILKEFAPKLSLCTYHLPDDPQVLRQIILEANPKYQIVEKFSKMYAYVDKVA